MWQKAEDDWIGYIVEKVYENYKNRKVVLWGKYVESEKIASRLKEKYQIEIAFYIDSDLAKIDNKNVFPTKFIDEKPSQYYVVIALAVYQSIKEFLREGGYKPVSDYYYFSDCVLRQEIDYYEDAHGNKIIGKYQGLKFVFSGFNSLIKIEGDVKFHNVAFYIHSNSNIIVENGAGFHQTELYVKDSSKIMFGSEIRMEKCDIRVNNDVMFELKPKCYFICAVMRIKDNAKISVGESVKVLGTPVNEVSWSIRERSVLEIGAESSFEYGRLVMSQDTLLKIGRKFTIEVNYVIALDDDTVIKIGEDCMFSYDIRMKSNDGHSIFDIQTGENINSLYHHRKTRRIEIGNHVWVGLRTTILYNTVIKDGSIIGAMSLVKNAIPNNCIAAGIPAKVIKTDVAWSRKAETEKILDCGEEYIHLTDRGC